MKPYKLQAGPHTIELGYRTCIMGIVNITPDSFSDGGKFHEAERAVEHGLLLATQGADILDIGGESTRPFADPVSENEEIRRVIPVIETLAPQVDIPISIDTTKAVVARKALDAGATIINDISAFRMDERMAEVVAASGAPVILMHMLGTPRTMQVDPVYADLMGEITAFLAERIDYARQRGIPRSNIVVDPGIGFGKTVEHNLQIIQDLGELETLEAPILVGPSRKAFIRAILKGDSEVDLSPEQPEVETGTQAVLSAAILNGTHMLRVHNVDQARTTASIADALKNTAARRPGQI